MGVYEEKVGNELVYVPDARSQWKSGAMDGGIGNFVDKFSGLGVNDSAKDNSLFQVMKAVEAAESTIKQQVEENNRLRAELQKRTSELEGFKSNGMIATRSRSDGFRDEHACGPYETHESELSPSESQHCSASNKVNGSLKVLPGRQAAIYNSGFAQSSSPSFTSLSPSRNQRDGEYDIKNKSSGHGLMPISDLNSESNPWKQDLVLKVRQHEEEISQLRKHLAEYSIKEAQIRNEKSVLEKRIAFMRKAFDQQQQDLVDAASKSLSYRQDIIEENIRLTYALQVAQQERSIFVSSLLPLLAEYSLQPTVLDAQSIANNLKVLFKHLQEKLLLIEAKLKESQYQITPWQPDSWNHPNFVPQSPSPSTSTAVSASNKMGLELVPQPAYPHGQTPASPPPNAQQAMPWDSRGYHNDPTNLVGGLTRNMEPDNVRRPSPSAIKNSAAHYVPAQLLSQGDSHIKHFTEDITRNQPPFNELLSGSDMDEPDASGNQIGKDRSVQWASGNSPYLASAHDDPNSAFSHFLPPVLEEPSSSLSEAAEDDPLPGIDSLQISGEAFPGRELQASGYSINGTTNCNFEWVRYLEDGSVNYIEGAKQPNYLVTADDVDSYLAIEVQPLDNRKRKGELVKVFANDHRKITCDYEMQDEIEKTLYRGHASYEVSLAVGFIDIWEPAILAIKREGFSIKCTGPRGVVVAEKFQPSTMVSIPYGHPTAFSLVTSDGTEKTLRMDSSSFRDTTVLIMRLFIMRAVEKRKGRKKGLFFHK
ncbi:hypothetical protein Syun_020560 [Stephania yunnanensis]|uniref:Uncharacterized protein n=1 Tax=Stephania yunnanensis TaxID=152371 RepID=A0AAP0IEU8_9MAGN